MLDNRRTGNIIILAGICLNLTMALVYLIYRVIHTIIAKYNNRREEPCCPEWHQHHTRDLCNKEMTSEIWDYTVRVVKEPDFASTIEDYDYVIIKDDRRYH